MAVHRHWCNALFFLVLFAVGVTAIFLSGFAPLSLIVGLTNEADFLVSLNVWTFVWGILAVIVAILYALAYCTWTGSGGWSLFDGVAIVLLSGPWLLIGQIELARTLAAPISGVSLWVYVFAWAALVLSYLNVPLTWYRMRGANLLEEAGAGKRAEYNEDVEPFGDTKAKRTQGKYTYE